MCLWEDSRSTAYAEFRHAEGMRNAKFLQTHTGTAYTEFRHAEVSAREGSPPQLRRGGRDIKKKTAQPTFDGADGVVLVKRMDDFLTKPPRLRGCGRFAAFLLRAATPPQLRRGAALTKNVLLIWLS